MVIDKIKKLGNNKYKIIIGDNYITTYDNVILENNLLYKKSIDKELFNKILYDTAYYDAYNKVVKYIMKRKRSENSIKIYLNKFGLKEDEKEKIIQKLKDINLINDDDYCISYINDRIYIHKEGINKIRNDLLKENISASTIDDKLSKVDKSIVDDKLEQIILKKIKINSRYSNYNLKQKLLNELINLGYEKEDILNIIDNNIKSDDEILKKEFNKTYNHLKNKYSGFELKNKIKQKLISKGFNADEINILLDEIDS